MEKLDVAVVTAELQQMSGWTLEDDKWLVKKYKFLTFANAMQFVNEVATIAEAENHHPFIAIDFRIVTLRLTSWKVGGITKLDLRCIAEFDSAYGQFQAGE
jgi:4a-hydroxytetrahydrobiopterin dehydratase